jgi:ectoine hydroxylase-related dioxygenase (phytanoyl-CoA dioxygenase family)
MKRIVAAATHPVLLSSAQVSEFERDGFVVVRKFYDAAQTAEIERWTDELSALPEEPGKHWVYREESLRSPAHHIVQRIEKFTEVHPGFAGLFHDGSLHHAVSELLGDEAVLFKEKINYKLPGGQGFKAHQDVLAGWNAYAPFYVTALVAIDECTEENGCLEMAAGWHRRGLLSEEWKPLTEETIARMEFVPCPTEPGDVIFFDSFAPHRSGPNPTDHARRVLYVTYNRASDGDHRERYFADKHRSFPPDVERKPGEVYVFRV